MLIHSYKRTDISWKTKVNLG